MADEKGPPRSAATARAERVAEKARKEADKAKRDAADKERKAARAKADELKKKRQDVTRQKRATRWGADFKALEKKERELRAEERRERNKA